jgi:hypothetical protein
MTGNRRWHSLNFPRTAEEERAADRHIREQAAEIQAAWTPRQEVVHRCGRVVDPDAVLIGGRLFSPVEFPATVPAQWVGYCDQEIVP